MFKQFLFLFTIFLPAMIFAQKPQKAQKAQKVPMPIVKKIDDKKLVDSAYTFYEKGLKAFNDKNYRQADSLYTISLLIKQHLDTYYNRALTRAVLRDVKGYCEDLCAAATRGDKECDTLFRKECGTADTIYVHLDNKPATRLKHEAFCVIYQSDFPDANVVVKFDKKGKFMSSETFVPPKTDKIPEEQTFPEFQGGPQGLKEFVKANQKFPPEAKKRNVSGKVVVKFAVNRMGYPENIRFVRTMEDCPECNAEAERLVSSMPRWKPGAINGKTAKFNYNLPLDFGSDVK